MSDLVFILIATILALLLSSGFTGGTESGSQEGSLTCSVDNNIKSVAQELSLLLVRQAIFVRRGSLFLIWFYHWGDGKT